MVYPILEVITPVTELNANCLDCVTSDRAPVSIWGELMLVTHSDRDTLVEKLQTDSLLSGLDPETLTQMVHRAIWREYAAGVVIFLEGDATPALYYVDSGAVKVVKMSPEGREQVLNFLHAGEIFGGMSVFVNRPAPATAITLEPTGIWLLPRDAIHQVLTANPAVALQVIEMMADRISDLVMLVADLSLHTVTARLARQLLEEAEGDTVRRPHWATQSEMAARLGVVPDVVNRVLRGLVEEGLIAVSRQQIRILNRRGLAAKIAPDRDRS